MYSPKRSWSELGVVVVVEVATDVPPAVPLANESLVASRVGRAVGFSEIAEVRDAGPWTLVAAPGMPAAKRRSGGSV